MPEQRALRIDPLVEAGRAALPRLRASTVPSRPTISPRRICCSSSSGRLLARLASSSSASNTDQYDVKPISTANSSTTRPNRLRMRCSRLGTATRERSAIRSTTGLRRAARGARLLGDHQSSASRTKFATTELPP